MLSLASIELAHSLWSEVNLRGGFSCGNRFEISRSPFPYPFGLWCAGFAGNSRTCSRLTCSGVSKAPSAFFPAPRSRLSIGSPAAILRLNQAAFYLDHSNKKRVSSQLTRRRKNERSALACYKSTNHYRTFFRYYYYEISIYIAYEVWVWYDEEIRNVMGVDKLQGNRYDH